jgi:hypothetical protein
MIRKRLRAFSLMPSIVVAFLLVATLGAHGADPTPGQKADGLKILDALLGGAPPDGACMSSADLFLLRPDPKKLSRLVAREGSAGQLSDGGWVADDAASLAARLGGELVVAGNGLAHVLIVEGADRRVDEYLRFTSSEGDVVWYLTGTQMRIDCPTNSDATPSLTVVSPSPSTDAPPQLVRSVTTRQDGIRLSMRIEGNPVVAGEPLWITTKLTNTGKTDLIWASGHCDNAVRVSGVMRDAMWRDGLPAGPRDFGDFKYYTTFFRLDGGPTIRLGIEPWGPHGAGDRGCTEVGWAERIPPGTTRTDRSRWDGSARWQLGPPPSGVATVTASFGEYKRAGDRGSPRKHIEASLDVLIVNGRPDEWLHPMEIIDAALADPAFAALMDPIDMGDRRSAFVQYDVHTDLWYVGVIDPGRAPRFAETFLGALVDPARGEVVALIERLWVRDEDPSTQPP